MVQLGGVLHNVHEKIVEIDSRSIQINDKNGVCIISKSTFSQKSKQSVQNQTKSQNETVVKNSNTQA